MTAGAPVHNADGTSGAWDPSFSITMAPQLFPDVSRSGMRARPRARLHIVLGVQPRGHFLDKTFRDSETKPPPSEAVVALPAQASDGVTGDRATRGRPRSPTAQFQSQGQVRVSL